MELVLTQLDTEPLPKPRTAPFIFNNDGLLTSSYKEKIQNNFFNSNPNSVFGIKQQIKSKQYQYTPSIETILKLSVFAIVIVATFS